MRRVTEWTTERDAELEKLLRLGQTQRQIAAVMGITLGAVGRRVRSTFPAFASSPLGPRKTGRKPERRSFAMPRPPKKTAPAPVAPALPKPANLVPLTQLEKHHCRWPSGDPRHPDFGFCGRARDPGGPYCAGHHYQSLSEDERRKFDAGLRRKA